MKKFTKKILNKKVTGESSYENIKDNAKKASKKLGIPEKLWMELSDEFPQSPIQKTCQNEATVFMLGFAIGWAELNNKIK